MREQKKQNFLSCLLFYAREGKRKLILSVILSVISITAGLVPIGANLNKKCTKIGILDRK